MSLVAVSEAVFSLSGTVRLGMHFLLFRCQKGTKWTKEPYHAVFILGHPFVGVFVEELHTLQSVDCVQAKSCF